MENVTFRHSRNPIARNAQSEPTLKEVIISFFNVFDMLNVALCMRIWCEVRNFAWHWWFSLQRCKTFCFCLFLLTSVLQNVCLCTMDFVSAGKNTYYYYMWTVCEKVVPRLNKHDDVIEWNFMKLPPPEMKSWLRPCILVAFKLRPIARSTNA